MAEAAHPSYGQTIAAARKMFGRDGEVEIDLYPLVSRDDETGAYVSAWIWVDDEDADAIGHPPQSNPEHLPGGVIWLDSRWIEILELVSEAADRWISEFRDHLTPEDFDPEYTEKIHRTKEALRHLETRLSSARIEQIKAQRI